MPPPLAADTIRLEAEAAQKMHTAGPPLAPVADADASRGVALLDFGTPGSWLEYGVTLDSPATMTAAIRSAGLHGSIRQYTVAWTMLGTSQPAATDTLTTFPGLGIG